MQQDDVIERVPVEAEPSGRAPSCEANCTLWSNCVVTSREALRPRNYYSLISLPSEYQMF